MKKINGKKVLAAILMGLTMSCAGMACAEPATNANSVSVQVEVKQELKNGAINWGKGADTNIEAVGVGLPMMGTTGSAARATAKTAAQKVAQRNLIEIVNGLQLDSETIVKDLVLQSDYVHTKVSGILRGAVVTSEEYNIDGSCVITMSVPMYGVSSLAETVVPELNKNVTPQAFEKVEETVLPPAQVQKTRTVNYTGVIIDASGLGLEPTFSPVIYDVNGRAVYGMKNIDKDKAISYGMVEYSASVQNAAVGSRAGENPLVIKATSVKGGANSVNKVNVVVSVEDADKILLANENSGMLGKCSVVFVK